MDGRGWPGMSQGSWGYMRTALAGDYGRQLGMGEDGGRRWGTAGDHMSDVSLYQPGWY